MLWSYLQGMETQLSHQLIFPLSTLWSYLQGMETYIGHLRELVDSSCFDPTYKGWKRELVPTVSLLLSLLWSYLQGMETILLWWPWLSLPRFDPTYKGWKLTIPLNSLDPSLGPLWSYLQGMETKFNPEDPILWWGLWSYLQGMETGKRILSIMLPKLALILPTRDGNVSTSQLKGKFIPALWSYLQGMETVIS